MNIPQIGFSGTEIVKIAVMPRKERYDNIENTLDRVKRQMKETTAARMLQLKANGIKDVKPFYMDIGRYEYFCIATNRTARILNDLGQKMKEFGIKNGNMDRLLQFKQRCVQRALNRRV